MTASLHPFLHEPLPKGWRVCTVDEVKSSGKHACVAGPFGSSISSKFFVEDGVPVIRGSNLSIGLDRFISDNFAFVTPEKASSFPAQTVVAGDLVFTCWGTIGQVGIVPENGPYDKYIISNKQLKLRVNTEILEPLFAYYFFACRQTVDFIKSQAIGSAVPGINLGILKALPILVPPLHVQRYIVNILSAYDSLIENNTRRINILEDIARRLFEDWFISGKAPAGKPVLAITKMPISEAFDIVGGGTPSKADPSYWDEGTIEWYTPTDLTRARAAFLDHSKDRITVVGLAKSGAQQFPANSIMMTSRATLGVFAINTGSATTNQGFINSIPNENAPLYWLFHWLKSNVQRFESIASGATFKEITKKNFRNLEIDLPDRASVQAYESLVTPIMQSVLCLLRANTNLRATRDLLLPKLISGEIEVCATEEEMEVAAA